MAKSPAAKANLLDALRKMARGSGTPRKGSDTPLVERPDLADLLNRWAEAKREAAKFDSLVQACAAQIAAAARDERLRASRRAGRVISTVRLSGGGVSCDVTQSSRYCKVPNETPAQLARVEQLRETFGDDFGRYFRERLDVTPTEGALADEDFLAGFVALLMEHYGERFAALFSTTQTFTATRAFHDEYTLRPEVEAKAQPFIEDETVKPYAPGVKQ